MTSVLFPFVGDSLGGSHIASRILIQNLHKINLRYEIILMYDNGVLSKYLKKFNLPFTVINKKNKVNKRTQFENLLILRNFLKEKNIKFVHTNDLRMHYYWSFLCLFLEAKHIWHQHSALWSRRNILFSSFSHKILTVSQYCKESFVFNMSKRAKVIGNPFDINYIEKRKGKKKNKNIIYIGKKSLQKRARLFVEVAKYIYEKNKKISFFLIGEHPFNSKEKKQLENFNIIFLDKNINVDYYFKMSDLLIAPGINEGFGRTLIEAMLYRVPVLASEDGAHLELIKNNKTGFFATKDDFRDFGDKALQILNIEDITKLTEEAYNFCIKNFNLENYINQFKEIYKI